MKRIMACFVFVVIFILPAHAAKMVVQQGEHSQIMQMIISPNGKYLACELYNAGIEIWDAPRGEFIKHLPDSFVHAAISMNETPVMWSQDGKVLFTSVRRNAPTKGNPYRNEYSVRIREIPSGRIIRTFPNLRPPLWTDGTILRVTDGKTIRTWRVSDGALVYGHVLQSPSTLKFKSFRTNYIQQNFSFSRNGKFLSFGNPLGTSGVYVWNTETGKLFRQINDKFIVFGKAAVSNNGRYLVAQAEDPKWTPPPPECNTPACYGHILKLHLWDLKEKKIIRAWEGFYSGAYHFSVEFFKDNKRFNANGNIYNIDTGKVQKIDAEVDSHTEYLSYSDQFLTGVYRQNPRIISTSTGKVLASFAFADDSNSNFSKPDLVIWTPQGYFNAPDRGRKRVSWKENGKMIPLDSPRDKALRTKFYNPRKVAASIAGGS